MKKLLIALSLMAILYIADWLWYQYHIHFSQLAMKRTDGYYETISGICYVK